MADGMSADDVLPMVSSAIISSQDGEDDNDKISSSSSSSEEDSSDEESEMRTLYAILMVNETRGETPQMEKLTDYVERVVPGYSKITFKQHFRFVNVFSVNKCKFVICLTLTMLQGLSRNLSDDFETSKASFKCYKCSWKETTMSREAVYDNIMVHGYSRFISVCILLC